MSRPQGPQRRGPSPPSPPLLSHDSTCGLQSVGSVAQPWSRRIEARTYCHATEEAERVATALAFAVPEGETSREGLEGHFGNPLIRITRRVEKRPAIRAVWSRWVA